MYVYELYAHCHLLELTAVSKTKPTSKVSLWTEFLIVHRHFCCQSMKWVCHMSECFCEPWNICKIKDPQNVFSTQYALFEQMPSSHFTTQVLTQAIFTFKRPLVRIFWVCF